MLFPIAPHISEYLWNTFEVEGPNIESSWPEFETTLIEAEEFELIIDHEVQAKHFECVAPSFRIKFVVSCSEHIRCHFVHLR